MATSNKKTPASKKPEKTDKAAKPAAPKAKAAEPEVKAKTAKGAIVPAGKTSGKIEAATHTKASAKKVPMPESKPSAQNKSSKGTKPAAATANEDKNKTGKGKKETQETVSKAALKVIAAAKASAAANSSKNKQPVKKVTVAVFTMDDVHEVLKNRREEAREQAEKREAAAKKAVTIITEAPQQQVRVLGAATLADILGFGSRPQAKVEDTLNKREVPEKYRKYYEALTSMRDKIQGKINQRGRVANPTDSEASLAVPAQTDDDDTFDHDFALSLVANEQDALLEIDAALDRIYEGNYGLCEITGKQIAAERLEAVPFARFSVEGQAQFEMQNRRRAQRATAFLDSTEDSAAFAGEETEE